MNGWNNLPFQSSFKLNHDRSDARHFPGIVGTQPNINPNYIGDYLLALDVTIVPG